MRVAILGVGSILIGDDRVGPYRIEILEESCRSPEEDEIRLTLAARPLPHHDPGHHDALPTADPVADGPRQATRFGVIGARLEMGTEPSPQVEAPLPPGQQTTLDPLSQWATQPRAQQNQSSEVGRIAVA